MVTIKSRRQKTSKAPEKPMEVESIVVLLPGSTIPNMTRPNRPNLSIGIEEPKEMEILRSGPTIQSIREGRPESTTFLGWTGRVRGMPNHKITGAKFGSNTDNDETNSLGHDSGIFFAETLLELPVDKVRQVEIEPEFNPFVAAGTPPHPQDAKWNRTYRTHPWRWTPESPSRCI